MLTFPIDTCQSFFWIGVVEEVAVDGCYVVVLVVGTLIAVAEVGDVIRTEPLFCLLNDEDVLFVVCSVT